MKNVIIDKINNIFSGRVEQRTVVIILGCQRSGTTLMLKIFKKNRKAKTFGEFSELSSLDKENGIRLNPPQILADQLAQVNSSLIVLKPIVELQHATKLLEYFDNTKIIWMYRNYKDVISSNLKKWGIENGIRDLTPVALEQRSNWRSENVSQYNMELIRKYYSLDMNPYDAAALFWYLRNSFFFEQQLQHNNNVIICKYEELVNKPLKIMDSIYRFCGHNFPGNISRMVTADSVNKGNDVQLSKEIEDLCRDTLEKLDELYLLQNT